MSKYLIAATEQESPMILTATRDFRAPQVIVITTDAVAPSEGNVVARYNETHDILTRTHYSGPKASIKSIRAAVAQVA